MANQTIVAVPTEFKEFKQLRTFIVKLVEQLDVVLGYRGSNPYVTANDLSVTGEVSTSTLAETIVELRKAVDELVEADEAGESVATERLDQIQAQTTIVDHSYTAPTASGAYVQAEMQDTMDSLESVNDKLNELLVILRTADIVS